jgi:hypothetical protein
MAAGSGSPAPLPPWLQQGRQGGRPPPDGGGFSPRALRGPGLVLAGAVLGWLLHAWRQPAPPPAPPPVAAVEPLICPPAFPCSAEARSEPASPHPARAHAKTPTRPLALHPLPNEGPMTDENRREALRAFAQQRASDLRNCLGAPERGPLRRVGAALEIDAHGAVAAVQILGGEGGSREVEHCYSTRLRAWRFPQALLQGDERLLVNFVL